MRNPSLRVHHILLGKLDGGMVLFSSQQEELDARGSASSVGEPGPWVAILASSLGRFSSNDRSRRSRPNDRPAHLSR